MVANVPVIVTHVRVRPVIGWVIGTKGERSFCREIKSFCLVLNSTLIEFAAAIHDGWLRWIATEG